MPPVRSEAELAAVARALAGPGAAHCRAERRTLESVPRASPDLVAAVRRLIEAGEDPLGEAFTRLRSPAARRAQGAVYTPAPIVASMLAWAAEQGTPTRVMDPGAGSGRFILAAAKRFPTAALVAVDVDPLAVLMLRANAAVLDLTRRLTLHCRDYRELALPRASGPTLFIGNPPYVRHHDIAPQGKRWLAETAAALGFKASALAGLHIHFFLKTRQLAREGDYGAFITSAEWLDVNYGSLLRSMLANGLGGTALHVLAPESMPFADTATTGAITCFRVSHRPATITVRAVASMKTLRSLGQGRAVSWSELAAAPRWSTFIHPRRPIPSGYIELGELCRVHRGQVTGGNGVWIEGAYPGDLPGSVLFPAVTRARELLSAGEALEASEHLRRVIDLPADLDALRPGDRSSVDRFLAWARRQGAHESYIASHRRAWWSVSLRAPAPILCTYMARRPPAFVLNRARARHLNIAHGLYPRHPLGTADLLALVRYLSSNVRTDAGRTYAGGLTKFEPRELERIPIPPLGTIHDIAAEMDSGAAHGGRRGRARHLPATETG
jgi:hypothetical protein